MSLIVPSPPKGWGEQITKSIKGNVDRFRAEFDQVKQDFIGDYAPIDTYPLMRWADTTAGVMRVRNLANDAWIALYTLDAALAMDGDVVKLSGDQSVAGIKTFSSFPITPSAAPTTDYQVANKKFVDDQIGAIPSVRYALLQNRQTQNTHGGTATSGDWYAIPFNTEYLDPNGIVDSGSLPAFTLAAGTYILEATCPFYRTEGTSIRLRWVDDSAGPDYGGSWFIHGSSYGPDTLHYYSRIVLAGSKQLRIEYKCGATVANFGLGYASNIAAEVYAQLVIQKVA